MMVVAPAVNSNSKTNNEFCPIVKKKYNLTKTVSYITSALADSVLLLTVVLIVSHSKLRNLTGLLTFVLCLSLLLFDTLAVIDWHISYNDVFKFTTELLFVISLTWMTIYGYHIVLMLYSNHYFTKINSSSCLCWIILLFIGFVIPLVYTIIYFIFMKTSHNLFLIVFYIIPTIYAVVNLIGFVIAIFLVSRNLRSMRRGEGAIQGEQRLLFIVLIYVRLVTIFGIGWSIVLIVEMISYYGNLGFSVMFLAFYFMCNLQGFILAITYLLSDEVRNVLFTAHPKLSRYLPFLKSTANQNQDFHLASATEA